VKLGVMLGAIFLVELSLMLVTDRLRHDMTGWAGAMLDAVTLTLVTALILWPLIIKPLRVALETEHAKAQAILDTASDAIITIDDHGIIRSQNRAAQFMFGVSDQDAVGRNINMIMPSPNREHHDDYLENYRRTGVKRMIGTTQQLDAVRAGGEVFPIELSISEVRAGRKRLFTAIIRDITERKRLAEEIRKMAHYDQLTGLVNRALFHDRLSHAIDLARRRRGKLGLLYLDLDRFKPVNDRYGHSVGDSLLCAVAERLRKSARSSDTVARLGGDEFAVILTEILSRTDAQSVAEHLKGLISEAYPLDGVTVSITVSIGMAVFPDDAVSGEDMVKMADSDMYRQKEQRKVGIPGA